MALPEDTAGYLRALVADDAGAAPLAPAVEALLYLLHAAVPSCLGTSLTVNRYGIPVTVTALAGRGPAGGSLTLHLPGTGDPGAEPGPVLVLWSGQSGVLAAARRDWLALLDLDPARAVIDADLVLPEEGADRLGGALADVATVDRALGVLLERRGLLPIDGRAVLVADAATAGTSLLVAALALLRRTPYPRP